jgi:hypothetical protein
VNGSINIGVPGFGVNGGGSQGAEDSWTVEVRYEPELGLYNACTRATRTYINGCATKAAEKKSQC